MQSQIANHKSQMTVRLGSDVLFDRGLIKGRWIEKPGERRRCFYRLTPAGRRELAEQRETWKAFIDTVKAVMGPSRA